MHFSTLSYLTSSQPTIALLSSSKGSGGLNDPSKNWIEELEGAAGSHSLDDLYDGEVGQAMLDAGDQAMDGVEAAVETSSGVFGSILEKIPSMSDISDAIGDALGTALNNTLGRFLYMVVSGVNWFFSIIYQFFEVFSGQLKVSYRGEYDYLTNIFFENSTISGIYWGMALIGVVLCFAFTIVAVVRKMFDGADKMQTTMGAILGSSFKSILIILSLNVVMVVVLNMTNVLMQRITYVFNAGSSLTEAQSIEFTDDQFATMGRVLNTIGNYSLNPSYSSRYNLNSCFNEIRADMLYLQETGVFDFYYQTYDAEGNEIKTWQSELQKLVFAASFRNELKMDVYYEGVSQTLLEIMGTLRNNTYFYPLDYYERPPAPLHNIPMDRVLFLACTYNAALNEDFNVNPSVTDSLRGPYYNGQKSIYDFSQVAADFNLIWGFNYIIFFMIIVGMWKEMLYIIMDCIARIYNMLLLYLVAPPFIALTPMDGGGKMKQWTTAFVVQCFGVFGTIVAMRLLMVFAPIVVSTDLVIFQNPVMDIIAKIFMIEGACLSAKKASSMFTGILADSAGWQSISASNLRDDYDRQREKSQRESEQKKQAKKQEKDSKKQEKDSKKQEQDVAKAGAKAASGTADAQDAKVLKQAADDKKKEASDGGGDKKDGGGDKQGGGDKKDGGGDKKGGGADGAGAQKQGGGEQDARRPGADDAQKQDGGPGDMAQGGGPGDMAQGGGPGDLGQGGGPGDLGQGGDLNAQKQGADNHDLGNDRGGNDYGGGGNGGNGGNDYGGGGNGGGNDMNFERAGQGANEAVFTFTTDFAAPEIEPTKTAPPLSRPDNGNNNGGGNNEQGGNPQENQGEGGANQ